MLSKIPSIKPILKWAYNPFWTYGVKNITLQGSSSAGYDLNDETFKILRDLRDGRLTGDSARHVLYRHAEILNGFASCILHRIIQRDLRIGMNVKTINQVFPDLIPTFDVMLAQKMDWKRLKYPCLSSPKLDGIRAIYHGGQFFTRTGKQLVGLDHIANEMYGAEGIDGELVVPGMSFQEGSGLIRSLNPTPQAKFYVFDIIGDNRPFIERLSDLEDLESKHIVPVEHLTALDKEMVARFYKLHRDQGYEGSVVKTLDYEYQYKRSAHWMKLKSILSLDLPVVSTFEGTGKYAGQLGGIICLMNDNEVRVGGGISDPERYELWAIRDQLIGRTAEVLYQEITPTNSLRHPRFLRWRFDK